MVLTGGGRILDPFFTELSVVIILGGVAQECRAAPPQRIFFRLRCAVLHMHVVRGKVPLHVRKHVGPVDSARTGDPDRPASIYKLEREHASRRCKICYLLNIFYKIVY